MRGGGGGGGPRSFAERSHAKTSSGANYRCDSLTSQGKFPVWRKSLTSCFSYSYPCCFPPPHKSRFFFQDGFIGNTKLWGIKAASLNSSASELVFLSSALLGRSKRCCRHAFFREEARDLCTVQGVHSRQIIDKRTFWLKDKHLCVPCAL